MIRGSRINRGFLLIPALSALISLPAPAITLPPGFSDSLVTSVSAPTALAFTPDGRLLITTQGGTLRVYQNGMLLPAAALTLGSRVCSNSERGLLGVAVDPAFATNHFIYLYYTFNKFPASLCPFQSSLGPVNRVSRFTMPASPTSNVIDPTTEVVLLDNILAWAGNHNGGDVQFGADGYLYASVGDGGCDFTGATGCGGANQAARLRYWLGGKILRIAPDGSIPPTNPFLGAGTARCNTGPAAPGLICQETFAWGFRNPFRIAFRPGTSQFRINDVGNVAWEEIDSAQAGADYGWSCREGMHTNSTTGACSPAPPGMVDPIFEYAHGATVPGTSSSGCNSITGGAFVPSGVWPTAYEGAYLFADFVCGSIFRLGTGPPFAASDFASGLGSNTAVTLLFGPSGSTQALYYTTYKNPGEVHRIELTGGPPGTEFFTLTPCRVIDTRDPPGTWGGPALTPGSPRDFPLAGRCGIPADAVAVSANVTMTDATASGSAQLAPAGVLVPPLATVTFGPGLTRANNAVLAVFGTPPGTVTATASMPSGSVHLIVDVNGYFR